VMKPNGRTDRIRLYWMIRRLLANAAACGVLIFVVLGFVAAANADQKDPRLPALFARLKEAPSIDAAAAIESQIWTIWFDSGDSEIDKLLDVGSQAMSARDFPAALEAFSRIIEKRPDFAEGWNRRATLYYLMGEYQKSLDDIARTLALEPRHFGALSGLGLVNLKLDRMAAAAQAFERVLAIDPRSEAAQQDLDMINTVLKRKSI
jgi:tetratricopeptide (TPR) repeat protein